MEDSHEITRLLDQWSGGDKSALDKLMPLVYRELKQIASAYLNGERPGHTLQPTALVHEAYLRLANYTDMRVESRKHFFVIAAQALRRVLVDYARRRSAARRSGEAPPGPDPLTVFLPRQDLDVVELSDALDQLAKLDPLKARLVELRFFGGLSVPECAATMDISAATVKREWAVAKMWLYKSLQGGHENDPRSMA